MGQAKKNTIDEIGKRTYTSFARINGDHPFKSQVPGGCVEYKARHRRGGKVAFFNFDLAKEMGLLPKSHPAQLNPELEREILETFSLVIINEYDVMNNVKVTEEDVYPKTFMATRYLQLQHPDKSGRTSGDGRSIWNGTVRANGITWDISSCGTGATKLSPACNINKKFYQTGDPSISYGCGLSEVSEGLETLFFSEVLNKNKLRTERILAIIEHEKGLGINVRANPNLMRPSHFFGHLKQGNHATLKQVADYYINRQLENKAWPLANFRNDKDKYFSLAREVARSFSEAAARFEDEYIFCWLDWDGDNILMDGGIIDYGSIRQFGLFHAEYRYDDVQRFSTTILEQKQKAKYIVQCFVQIADFLTTGKKRSLSSFRNHALLGFFDHHFNECKDRNLLQKIGFRKEQQELLLKGNRSHVAKFRKAFTYFERAKSKRGLYKVADGVTRDAVFCMRDILREFPQLYLTRQALLPAEDFIEVIRSSYARRSDLRLTPIRCKQIARFQDTYLALVGALARVTGTDRKHLLLELTMRASIINKYDRVTGDSISFIVQKVQKVRPKLPPQELFELTRQFTTYQNLNPDQKRAQDTVPGRHRNILQNFYSIVRDCREGI